MLKPPQNSLAHDLVLALNGNYIPFGRDLGLRFKLIMFTVMYHSPKPFWARLMGGFPDAATRNGALKEVIHELQHVIRQEDPTDFTYNYGVYLHDRLLREEQSVEIRRTLRSAVEFYIDQVEGLEGLRRSYQGDTDVDHQLAEMLAKMVTWDISNVNIHQENRELRDLLATQIGGMGLYRDDGELSDSSEHPPIDFRRDTPGLIKRCLIRRGELKREAQKKEQAT